METVLHYPSLKTVLMVEHLLEDAQFVESKEDLKRKLPKKVMHQTLNVILEYLQSSGKIVIFQDKILWTWNPEATLALLREKYVEMTPDYFQKLRSSVHK